MPTLSYPSADFTSNTLIRSADVNGKFNAIKTLLNTTKLDSTNVQSGGLTRDRLASGTASHVIINDGSGVMSSEATLATTRGGTGASLTPTNTGDVIQVSAGAFVLGSPPAPAVSRVNTYFQLYHI